MNDDPCLGSILVNYGYESEILDLAPRLAQVSDEVVIVNNEDNPIATLRDLAADSDDITYIEAEENRGYAGGNNLGIEALRDECEAIFIVNPDVEIPNIDGVNQLVRDLVENEEVGIVAPAIGDDLIEAQHGNGPLIRAFQTAGLMSSDSPRDDHLVPRAWVTGCAMMLATNTIEDAGLLNEVFFMYAEEVEYCFRVREHGSQVVFDPGVTVGHDEEDEFSDLGVYYRARNTIRVARLRFGPSGVLFALASELILLQAVLRSDPGLLGSFFRGISDGLEE